MNRSIFTLVWIVLILLCGPVLSVRAENADAFASANSALASGDTSGAIEQYETLLRRGNIHPEIYCNLALAFQQGGDTAHAILNYQRVLLLDPTSQTARNGLSRAGGNLSGAWWDQIPTFGSHISILIFTIGVWLFFIALAARWRRLLGTVNLWTFLCVVAAIAAILAATSYCLRDGPEASPNRAVVLGSAKLRATFTEGSGILTTLAPGAIVEVVSTNGIWTNCRLPDQTQGWLPSNLVEKVIPQ